MKDPVLPGGGTRIQAVTKILTEFVRKSTLTRILFRSLVWFWLNRVKQRNCMGFQGTSSRSNSPSRAWRIFAHQGPGMGGEFILQNGLEEVAGRSLGHRPHHGSREAFIVTSALSTCDPGYLLTETLPMLHQASIRLSCIALTAELHVCRNHRGYSGSRGCMFGPAGST